MALTRAEMDGMGCQHDGCDCAKGPVYLTQRCHPGAGTQACYEKGVLRVECRVCKMLVAEVAVAGRVPSPLPCGHVPDSYRDHQALCSQCGEGGD